MIKLIVVIVFCFSLILFQLTFDLMPFGVSPDNKWHIKMVNLPLSIPMEDAFSE